MAIKTYVKVVASILLAAAIAAATAAALVPSLVNIDNYRAQIISMAQKALNRRVSYETASFSWHFTPSIVFRGVTIAEKSGDFTFMEVGQLNFRLAILPLLRKEVRLREIVIERPVLILSRNQAGVLNIDDLITEKPSEYKIHLESVRIRNALVRFSDRSIGRNGFTASLENLDLDASGLARGKYCAFRLSTTIPDERGNTAVSISGTARIPSQEESLRDVKFDVTLAAKNLNAGRYWPYYGRYLPCERVRGRLDMEGAFKGKPIEFTAKGRLGIRDLRFNYPRVFHAILAPRDVRLVYDLELTPKDVMVKSFDLTVDGLRVTGGCALGDIHSKDPRITARAVTSPFRLEDFRQYIPYGIIVRDTSDFIERHIKGGIYRLDEGRLDGRLSQILHMERGDNYNVLFIRGRVEKGLVTFGPRVPTFNDIRGNLELTGKDFYLHRMTGNFGGSPFTLEGKIADYTLEAPASYPFTTTITPREAEVAWLFRQGKPSDMAFNGQSILHLAGSGSTADYRLAGSWDLTGANYRYQELIHKPAGIANRLRFTARLGSTEARLADFLYKLSPLKVSAGAVYRYNDPAPLTFAVTTNRFMVNPQLPILPGLQKYHPSGSLQTHVSGSGNPAEPNGIRLSGDVTLEEFSVHPFEQIKPLSGVTGTIHLTESALETERLSGRAGDSAFAVKGRVAGLSNPTADLVFSSPELHPEDFGFYSSGQIPEVKNLSGGISLKDRNLTIISLSGVVNRSTFTMNGEILDIDRPEIALRVDFPNLRVEDVTPFTRLKRAGKEERRLPLKARLTSAVGSARDIPFERLATDLSWEIDRLAVQAFRVGAFGGTVSGNGEADFAANGGPMYQAHYRLDHVDAGQLLRAAGVKPHLTGLLTAEGELSARGKTREDLRKTAHTIAWLHLQEGELVPSPSSEGSDEAHIPYSVLDASVSLEEEALSVQDLNAGVFGGTVSGNGRANFAANGGPMYRAHYRLDHVDTGRLLRAAGVKLHLTGPLAAKGEFTAQGTTREELKNTAQGNGEIVLTDGVCRLPAGAGLRTAHEFPFKRVQASFSLAGKAFVMQSARVEAFGGTLSGNGDADFGPPDGPVYRLNCQLANINAANFFRVFDVTRDLSGTLNLQGKLTARGDSVTALKRTVQGTVTVDLDKGSINKFKVISKVFSLLNVSQLLDFRLPDMVNTGMPYDRIDGNFSFNGGKVSTTDLSMNSPSLNMTIVGNADIVNRDMDMRIGVQPLQTVSKIVSRIPIIGWILTGGKKRFLVVFYEAKGKWDNPMVSTVEMTSLPRGVFNIFKRAFNLPDALITEPGKVILGK